MPFEHIVLPSSVVTVDEYSGSGRGNFSQVTRSDKERVRHGDLLKSLVSRIPESFQSDPQYISNEDPGVYLKITSEQGYELKLDSLDNNTQRLCSVKSEGDCQVATILLFDEKRRFFVDKLEKYAREDNPKNIPLFTNIRSIELADLESFWTSFNIPFPAQNTEVWWEVWLSRRSYDRREVREFMAFCESKNVQFTQSICNFEQYSVIAVKATRSLLKQSTTLISCLSELRALTDTSHFFLNLSPFDQKEWAANIIDRVRFYEDYDVSVNILDTGVNWNQPLLEGPIDRSRCFVYREGWPEFDSGMPHGTYQAGLIAYGDLQVALSASSNIDINYSLESTRIIPPANNTEPVLMAAAMHSSVSKSEANEKTINRIFSLAITADIDGVGGQPSSWSSEIDQLSFDGRGHRLFVVSTGNIRGQYSPDYRQAVFSSEIEDPAQSWNAITVGSYTDKVNVSEPTYRNWRALAEKGDICPTSRSSNEWGWNKHSPFKPDVVAEGGNLLISPDGENITNADCVSLVTTADINSGVLFSDHRESSAATALVSRIAAKIWATYKNFRSETVRALICHAADWTEVMERYVAVSRSRHAKEAALRTFGYGVPSLDKAIASGSSYLTMVLEDEIKPYQVNGSDLKFDEMHFIELPWPKNELLALGAHEVKLRVTLSYFIQPNPGRRGASSKFRYQPFGLRFKLIRPGEDQAMFVQRVNVAARGDDYSTETDSSSDKWVLGDQLQKRGSLHQDTWVGSAAELASLSTLAIFPVAGWWKQNPNQLINDHSDSSIPYSIVVSIDAGETDYDIYTPVSNIVNVSSANIADIEVSS